MKSLFTIFFSITKTHQFSSKFYYLQVNSQPQEEFRLAVTLIQELRKQYSRIENDRGFALKLQTLIFTPEEVMDKSASGTGGKQSVNLQKKTYIRGTYFVIF